MNRFGERDIRRSFRIILVMICAPGLAALFLPAAILAFGFAAEAYHWALEAVK